MNQRIREWFTTVGILALAFVLVYAVVIAPDPNAAARRLHQENIAACERSKARFNVIARLWRETANAREATGNRESDPKLQVTDLRAADNYRAGAAQILALTPQDCQAAYPAP